MQSLMFARWALCQLSDVPGLDHTFWVTEVMTFQLERQVHIGSTKKTWSVAVLPEISRARLFKGTIPSGVSGVFKSFFCCNNNKKKPFVTKFHKILEVYSDICTVIILWWENHWGKSVRCKAKGRNRILNCGSLFLGQNSWVNGKLEFERPREAQPALSPKSCFLWL